MQKSLLIVLICFWSVFTNAADRSAYLKGEFVTTPEVATKIAEAVLVPIYGTQVLAERPFIATFDVDHWHIKGQLKVGIEGGVAEMDIKKNGLILKVIHGK